MRYLWQHLHAKWPLFLLLFLPLGGCKEAAKEAAKAAAPGGVQASIQTLAQPSNQQQLDELAGTPAVHRLGESLGVGIGEGIVTGGIRRVQSAAPLTQIHPTTRPAQDHLPDTAPTTRAATTQPSEVDLNAAVTATVRSAVQEGIRAGLGPDAQEMARQMATQTSVAAVGQAAKAAREDLGPAINQIIREQLAPAIAASIRNELGPALGRALREEIAPGVRQVMHDAVRGAVEGTATTRPSQSLDGEAFAREISKGAALGVGDAMAQMGSPDPVKAITGNASTMMWVAIGLLTVAGLITIGLIIALLVLALVVWRTRQMNPQTHPGKPDSHA